MTYSDLFRALYRVRRASGGRERAAIDTIACVLWALARQEGRAQ